MKLTAELKKWLIDNNKCKADATDEQFKQAAAMALADGSLALDKLTELTTSKQQQEASTVSKRLETIETGLTELLAERKAVKEAAEAAKEADAKAKADADAEAKAKTEKEAAEKASKGQTPSGQKLPSLAGVKKILVTAGMESDGEEKEFDVRVKEAAEQYDDTSKSLTYPAMTKGGKPHPLAGQSVKFYAEGNRTVEDVSDLGKAVSGAYIKFLAASAQRGGSKTLGFQALPQHDKELLCYAMENLKWAGSSDGGDYADIKDRKLTPHEQKALIDDAASGGLEAAPIVFDDMVIQAPLLNGELFPLVNQVPLDRGRRVESVSTGKVTGSWGGVDDTAISLFNTASYVAAFDTTIFRWQGAIRIGLDFLSDSPIDFGSHVSAQYGERLLEDLDDVVAAGNGTTQPEGVINKSGTTSVNFGGSTSIGNYESLRFGVAKPEHGGTVASSAVFCGTETSYQRARAIPVGASDARRLGGMDYSSYRWMERPYKINESLSNQQIFYAILARYRMYVRRGLTIRTSTEGDTLIRANEMLMIAMARYGGQLERGAAAAITTSAPA